MPANLRPRPSRSWHTLGISESIEASGSCPQGLTSQEAAKRLAEHGPNEFGEHEAPSAWAVLADQFRNVLIWILLIAGVLSLMLGETIEAAPGSRDMPIRQDRGLEAGHRILARLRAEERDGRAA